jgi:hypothetical protein
MDAEQTIADFERLERIFAAPDHQTPQPSAGTRLRSLPFHTESVISRAYPFRLRFLSGAGRFGISLLELYEACLRKMVVPTYLPMLSGFVKRGP